MNPKYPHRRWSAKRRIALVVVMMLGVFAGAGGLLVYLDLRQNGQVAVQGTSQVVAQAAGSSSKKFIVNEPLFGLELPADWKEISRLNTSIERSITWQATKKYADNRMLKIYIDLVPPTLAVNKMLPVTPQGSQILAGDISDNCANFTSGGSMEVKKAVQNRDTPAKWMGVDFICDMDNIIDNQIGVGSTAGFNQIVMTGSKGVHKYFFVYIDRNIQPDPSILKDALASFRVK